MTFVYLTELDSEDEVVVNLDHVSNMMSLNRGTALYFAVHESNPIIVKESVDAIMRADKWPT